MCAHRDRDIQIEREPQSFPCLLPCFPRSCHPPLDHLSLFFSLLDKNREFVHQAAQQALDLGGSALQVFLLWKHLESNNRKGFTVISSVRGAKPKPPHQSGVSFSLSRSVFLCSHLFVFPL